MAEVLIYETPGHAGRTVADHIAHSVDAKPQLVLGVATGSTPLPVYGALRDHVAVGIDFSQASAFALDEYVGLSPDDPRSSRAAVHREVTVPLGLSPERVHVPDGDPQHLETAGQRFEALIEAAHGVDIQLLGIGGTGHIAFNEPGSSFGSLTRVKTLTDRTRHDNARFFDALDEVPHQCITQGLGTILRARHLILMAFGPAKAQAVKAAVEGPVTSSVPASAIQLHPHVTVVLDEQAASALAYTDYYREAQSLKPVWQGL